MFNKIAEICESLSKITNDELRKNGIESIMILAWSTDFDSVVVSKGRFEYVMAQIGRELSRLAKKSGLSLREVLEGIYAAETELKQFEEGGEDGFNI